MKKVLLLILLLFLLTGCQTTYELTLESDVFIENLEIINNNPSSWKGDTPPPSETLYQAINSIVSTDYREMRPGLYKKETGKTYYDINDISKDDSIGVSYKGEFNLDEYKYSTIINTYFNEFNYNYDTETINLSIMSPKETLFSNDEINRVIIKFNTNHDVINHNANEIVDNNYYFYIDRDNYNIKQINLELTRKFSEKTLLIEEGYLTINSLRYIYIALGSILFIGLAFILLKVKKANR